MLSEQEHIRYSKQTILPEIGPAGQERLRDARVLVVGAGGLGCPVLQYLAAAGIGTLGIADGDNVDISNLQRQVLYTTADVGKGKAATAAEKLTALNPHVHFHVHPVFIDSSNALDLIREYDIVVDGSDNFATRYLVNDACVMLGKPMVSGAIYKFEGQVSVFNYKGGPTYRCLFPEPPGPGDSPNCADIGVVATLPGIVGTTQANEVIKMITGIGDVLSGRLLVIDTLGMSMHTFNFRLNETNLLITSLPTLSMACDIQVIPVDHATLQHMLATVQGLQLVDVREVEEHAIDNIGGINLPLSANSYGKLEPSLPVAVYCASGVRSALFAKTLAQNGFSLVYDLRGGMAAIGR
ncbi:molybdopterin-synthase adenylyltransferase MoeB [Nemorincola caseinilytica]|uniref:Molybdopterin-synthase adenylyltransferase MoeB n=1 Tax=Nemorincola caseinilytica TaxID=2054315 RepID=A0ABP8N646_9BACT